MFLYRIVIFYVKIGLFLFYKKITITGKENVPKNGPILFVANHQNAMMDPLVIAIKTSRVMYFLARASAFKNKLGAFFLRTLHAIPIYRVRDGVDSKAKNEAVFDECLGLFNKKENILIFPEGSHHIKRQVRSLRAGFTRMVVDYIKANPNKELTIIPIGLNYDNTFDYAKSLHIIYGKPINAKQFFDENDTKKTIANLIEEAHQKLKEITVYIPEDNYEAIFNYLTEEDYLHPMATNKKVKYLSLKESVKPTKKQETKNIFYRLMQINSMFPFLIWNWLKPKIEAKEFISTAKFSLGLTVFPIFYTLQSLLIFQFFGSAFALIYLLLCFILVFLSTKTR